MKGKKRWPDASKFSFTCCAMSFVNLLSRLKSLLIPDRTVQFIGIKFESIDLSNYCCSSG